PFGPAQTPSASLSWLSGFCKATHATCRRGPPTAGMQRFPPAGSAGKKLDDFAPVRGSAVTVLLQTALDDFLEFRPPAPPTGERAGRADQWSRVCSNLTTGRRPLLGILILCHTWPCDDNIG